MEVVSLNAVPGKGFPVGVVGLIPEGDRGPTYGKSQASGIPAAGKIAGFWTAPYDGRITAVYMSVDQGGVTIRFRRRRNYKKGNPTTEDIINRNGYTILAPATGGAHKTFANLSDFLDINVIKGDVFTTEIVELFDPAPTDVAGNLLVIQTDGSMPQVSGVGLNPLT